MTMRTPRIVVVIVAYGDGVTTAVGRWSWLDERVVFDPSGRVDPAMVGDRVCVVPDLDGLDRIAAEWVLLVGEDESMHPGSLPILRDAVARAPEGCVFAFPVIAMGLGLVAAAHRPAVRLAPIGTRLVLDRALELAFDMRGRQRQDLPVVLARERGGTITAAIQWIGASATALAALAQERHVHAASVVWHAGVAVARTLTSASRVGRLGLGRLVLAVLDGYRVIVVHAKLWERRRDRVRELG